MRKSAPLFCALLLSLSARRAWIEIHKPPRHPARRKSLSARRAWIEIQLARGIRELKSVALRKESVDRNFRGPKWKHQHSVALRKESVDRNLWCVCSTGMAQASLSARRAWIEIVVKPDGKLTIASLSARRAWIEMPPKTLYALRSTVALRKESVDRNCAGVLRRIGFCGVALRKESVDRNLPKRRHRKIAFSRSPQGERG